MQSATADYGGGTDYKSVRTLRYASDGRSQPAAGAAPREGGGTLQHPLMTGKISLRDKSTWAIKKRRELAKPTDMTSHDGEQDAERYSRRLMPPGT